MRSCSGRSTTSARYAVFKWSKTAVFQPAGPGQRLEEPVLKPAAQLVDIEGAETGARCTSRVAGVRS